MSLNSLANALGAETAAVPAPLADRLGAETGSIHERPLFVPVAKDFSWRDDPSAKQEVEAARAQAVRVAQQDAEELQSKYRTSILALESAAQSAAQAAAEDVVALAMTLASALVGAEIRASVDSLTVVIQSALAGLGDDKPTAVRLSPGDHDRITSHSDQPTPHVALVADATLSDGDCIVESPDRVVDASTRARLESIHDKVLRLYTESRE